MSYFSYRVDLFLTIAEGTVHLDYANKQHLRDVPGSLQSRSHAQRVYVPHANRSHRGPQVPGGPGLTRRLAMDPRAALSPGRFYFAQSPGRLAVVSC